MTVSAIPFVMGYYLIRKKTHWSKWTTWNIQSAILVGNSSSEMGASSRCHEADFINIDTKKCIFDDPIYFYSVQHILTNEVFLEPAAKNR